MPIIYQTKNGIEYAVLDGRSIRKGTKVTKESQQYLGRVIDKKNHIFYNRKNGIYQFDERTGAVLPADPSYTAELKDDGRKKKNTVLDFGDVFFVDQLIRSTGYDKVIDAVDYRNSDTLHAMVLFYILTEYACVHAQTWYQGSFASVLYPNADLTSQRLSDFIHSLGDEDHQRSYFQAHINWVKKNVCNDPAIIVDSTGLPNAIDTYLTQYSNHNGKISHEIRMTSAVQRDTGYPLLYRLVPGNVVDTSTQERTILTLEEYDVQTDLALLDAGYYTNENVDRLCDSNIDFVSRLPERYSSLYDEVIEKCRPSLQKKSNLYEFNGRHIYLTHTDVKIGTHCNHDAFAYIGLDTERMTDEIHQAEKTAKKYKKPLSEIHEIIARAGLFILISTILYKDEDILQVYYTRQLVEQYYDVEKGISRLTPLRVHSKESIFGHLLLSQIAATINLYIQKKMECSAENREELFLSLRNQKCQVYKSRVITCEAVSRANEFYDAFNINCALAFKKEGDHLTPQNQIDKHPSFE